MPGRRARSSASAATASPTRRAPRSTAHDRMRVTRRPADRDAGTFVERRRGQAGDPHAQLLAAGAPDRQHAVAVLDDRVDFHLERVEGTVLLRADEAEALGA